MARKPAYKAQRKDWAELERIELSDGTIAVKWHNVVTGEDATLREGNHPIENPNAVALPAPMVSPAAFAPTERDTSDDDEVDDERDAVDSVMRMLRGGTFSGGRADVKLYRKRPDGALEYCGKYTPEEFLEGGHDLIREQWGAGRYQVILYATNEEGRNYARRAMNEVNIAQQPASAIKSAGGEQDRVIALLERMDRRIEQLEHVKPIDPAAQMAGVFALMKGMREAMGIDRVASPAPAPVVVDPIANIKTTLELIEMLREQANPKPEPDDPLSIIAPKALELLGKFADQRDQPVQPLPQIQTQPITQPLPQLATEQSGDDMKIKLALAWLKAQAAAKADPVDTAETIWQFVPDEVIAFLRTDQWTQLLLQADASLGASLDWLAAVRTALLKIADEESAAESITETTAPTPKVAPIR